MPTADRNITFSVNGNSMVPTFSNGDVIKFDKFDSRYTVDVGDVIVFNHPFKKNLKLIKRVTHTLDSSNFYVQGDNPGILESEDSHNFGYIHKKTIIAIKKRK
ncbi:MAG: S26 family signal peptidase [Candidatus Marinimicrobia bacterium]|nr:S26 family signal peptidase [Candidatus Neomarinimicrobiota bacterium]